MPILGLYLLRTVIILRLEYAAARYFIVQVIMCAPSVFYLFLFHIWYCNHCLCYHMLYHIILLFFPIRQHCWFFFCLILRKTIWWEFARWEFSFVSVNINLSYITTIYLKEKLGKISFFNKYLFKTFFNIKFLHIN